MSIAAKQRIANTIKYNNAVYSYYYILFSFLLRILASIVRTDEHLILFNSFAGRRYDDSPKEIYLKMKEDQRFKDYRFVWAFHEPEKYVIPGAEIIRTDTLKYFITALKARVWITNNSLISAITNLFLPKATSPYGRKDYIPAKYYGNGAGAEFEGIKVRVPADVDGYLTRLYGDWRTPPNMEGRAARHPYEICDLKRPYTYYIN